MNSNMKMVAIFLGFELGIWSICIIVLPKLAFIPYNIREIVSLGNPFFTAAKFTFICFSIFGLPLITAQYFITLNKNREIIFIFIGTVLFSVFTFFLLNNSVPVDSIYDILGAPIFNWSPRSLELTFRFTGIYAAFTTALGSAALTILALQCLKNKISWKGFVYGLIFYFVSFVYAHWVIVIKAGTDNLTELMARNGCWASSAILWAGVYIIGLVTGWISLMNGKNFYKFILCGLFFLISIYISYQLFSWGTVQSLQKYGKNFSAMQFLLSPERSNYIYGLQVVYRYCIAYFSVVLLICLSQLPASIMYRRQKNVKAGVNVGFLKRKTV